MNALILVLLVPFFSAIALALLRGHPRLEKGVALASSLGLTAYVFWLLRHVDTHGIQVSMIGGYLAPYGIAFVADRLACIMLCLSMTVGSVVLAYTCFTVTPLQQRHFFFPFFLLLSYKRKLNKVAMPRIGAFIAVAVLIDMIYNIMPSMKKVSGESYPFLSGNLIWVATAVVGIGGVCVWAYLNAFAKNKLIPVRDPRIVESLTYHG